jgi:L,D-transpeptidase ErfK/SrfK
MRKFLLLAIILFSAAAYAEDADFTPFVSHIIQKGESFYKIAQDFDLGVDELLQANPEITDPKIIRAGETIILPTTHLLPDVEPEGIVINLAETQLYFFADEGTISFPISIGADEKTPTGKTKVVRKQENPSWTPPASIREENPDLPEIVPAGPNNPLGNYALYLDSSRNYKMHNIMIHGTNAPRSIGSKVSHGCIRLYPRDIERLFYEVEIDTPVRIINQPIKVSEINNEIYLEVHLKENPEVIFEDLGVKKLICKRTSNCETRINWQKVDDVVIENRGIPVRISRNLNNFN